MTQGSTGQKSEPITSQLNKLARADIPPEEFFNAFFNLIRLSMGAEAGNLWLYNSENQQLIPKIRAIADAGPLKEAPDDVFSKVAYRSVEQNMPVLYYPEEGNTLPALENIGVMTVPIEMDKNTSAIVLVARTAGEGRQYTPQDIHTLQSLCVYLTVYLAHYQLKNSALLSTRLAKLAEVEADLAGTQEKDKMAFILANRSREMIFFDRAFVAFPSGSSFKVAAVSGVDDVQQNTAVVANIRDLLREVGRIGGDWHFTEDYLEKVEDDALRDKLALYFATAEYKSVLLMRIEDEKGLLAVIGCERRAAGTYASADFQFLQGVAKISAKALRRAEDFRNLPGIELVKKAQALKVKALGPARNRFFLKIAGVVVTAAILFFGKWDFNMSGDCEIVPALVTAAAPRIDGAVKTILKNEGDYVRKGEAVALLDDRDIQNKIAETQVQITQSRAKIDAMRLGNVANMGLEELNLKRLEIELEGLQLNEEATRITSPQDGIVVSHRDEINASLDAVRQRGEPVMRIADISQLAVEVEVAERDVRFVRPGQTIEFVLAGAPGDRVYAKVDTVSPASRQVPGKNVFIARGALDNSKSAFHPWLKGTARISAGKRAIGYVVFRSSIDWIYTKVKLL